MGVACLRTGRKFIGVEIDAEHFETARARIEAELEAQAPVGTVSAATGRERASAVGAVEPGQHAKDPERGANDAEGDDRSPQEIP